MLIFTSGKAIGLNTCCVYIIRDAVTSCDWPQLPYPQELWAALKKAGWLSAGLPALLQITGEDSLLGAGLPCVTTKWEPRASTRWRHVICSSVILSLCRCTLKQIAVCSTPNKQNSPTFLSYCVIDIIHSHYLFLTTDAFSFLSHHYRTIALKAHPHIFVCFSTVWSRISLRLLKKEINTSLKS